MRTFSVLFSLLCFSATVKSQVPAGEVAPEDAAFNATYAGRTIPKVTGRLLNIPADELKNLVIKYTLVTPFSRSQVKKTATAQPDGTFTLELDYPLPYQQIWFAVGDYFYAGIYANTDLDIELDMKKIKAVEDAQFNGDGVYYGGADGPLNTYLNNYVLYRRSDQLRLSGKISGLIFSQTAIDSVLPTYNILCDSIKQIQDSYIAASPSPYSWILENERLSNYYGQLCIKYFGKVMADTLWKKIKQHKSYLVSNNSAEFYNYQTMYIGYLLGSKKTTMIELLDRNIQTIDSIFLPAKADYLKFRLNTSADLNDQKIALDHILSSMHTGWCIAVVKKETERTIARIDEINATMAKSVSGTKQIGFGKPLLETPFGASLYKAPDVKAAEFIFRLKQAFSGKAIIIDRWATWCLPCLAEMPHSKELEQQSKDLPVVFVYLCTLNNSTEDKWKTKVAELEQPGVHFLINEIQDADLSKYFSFNGYPGYAFIDKTGSYKPGAINRVSEIGNRETLVALISK